MKILATLYSLVLSGVSLWAWGTYFVFKGSTEEHLLPAIALYVVSLPSSFLMERLIGQVPWILNSVVTMLSIVTGLGAIQAIVMWLVATRFTCQRR